MPGQRWHALKKVTSREGAVKPDTFRDDESITRKTRLVVAQLLPDERFVANEVIRSDKLNRLIETVREAEAQAVTALQVANDAQAAVIVERSANECRMLRNETCPFDSDCTARCREGFVILGGGCDSSGVADLAESYPVTASRRFPDLDSSLVNDQDPGLSWTGWNCQPTLGSGAAITTAYAICCPSE